MEGSSQVLSLAVDVRVELREDFDHLHMTFVTGNMKRCPSIGVALIQKCLGELQLLFKQEVITLLEVALLGVDPDVSEKPSLLFLLKVALCLLALRLDPGGSLRQQLLL